jgi:glycosyltransferase involved in cell wall biosynthesis
MRCTKTPKSEKHEPVKITVIIPSLNQGIYIGDTLRSVFQQEADVEVIVIDGGSTDETLEILKKNESGITRWISEKDSGQTEAINKGLKMAGGDIVTWLNSDDVYEPGALAHISEVFKNNPGAGLVHGKARIFGKHTRPRIVGPDKALKPGDYLAYMRFPQPASFFSREAIHNAGPLNPKLHFAMDYELTAKTVLAGFKVVLTGKVLAGYRFHENSKSNHDLKFLHEWTQEVFTVLQGFAGGKQYASELQQLYGQTIVPVSRYNNNIQLSPDEIEQIFLAHLDLHFHYYYRALDKEKLQTFAAYLRNNYLEFYRKHRYRRYLLRAKFLPTFVHKAIRKFTR